MTTILIHTTKTKTKNEGNHEMNVRKIVAALAIVAGAVGGSAALAVPAEAVSVPKPIGAVKVVPKVRHEVPNGTCRFVWGGKELCVFYQYKCPGEPFPPLASGVIPACKRQGVYAVKTWRIIIY